jgi:hypothetical protein
VPDAAAGALEYVEPAGAQDATPGAVSKKPPRFSKPPAQPVELLYQVCVSSFEARAGPHSPSDRAMP